MYYSLKQEMLDLAKKNNLYTTTTIPNVSEPQVRGEYKAVLTAVVLIQQILAQPCNYSVQYYYHDKQARFPSLQQITDLYDGEDLSSACYSTDVGHK